MGRDDHPILGYAHPRRAREGLFAGRFVALSVVGLFLGTCFLLVDTLSTILVYLKTAAAFFLEPAFLLCFARICVDMLLLMGSIGALRRSAEARRMLVMYANGEFVVCGVAAIGVVIAAISSGSDANQLMTSALGFTMVWLTCRCIFAFICLYACRGMRADFYFKATDASAKSAPRETVPVVLDQRSPAFIVRGRDQPDGKAVEYESNARSEALARKAAIMLGLDPDSLVITPIAPPMAGDEPDRA